MFTGLCAFPLTPLSEGNIDEARFVKLVERICDTKVDSIGVLGSTGSYAYLTRQERLKITQLSVQNSGNTPVIVGIGALGTREVLNLADDAQKAGANAVLLAPISYQKLSEEEVYSLYETVTKSLSIPLCVYDNPTTTHFSFSNQLHGDIAKLPNVASIKIPAVPNDLNTAKNKINEFRTHIPKHVTVGISGDPFAATGLSAGCDAWYSVIAGLFPNVALDIMRSAKDENTQNTTRLSEQLNPLWDFFIKHGSLRVIATAAEILGLVSNPSLPLPVKSLQNEERQRLANVINQLELS